MGRPPDLSQLASFVVRVYYRFETDGPPVPRQGPALLIANHPNALLDPAVVLAASRRGVCFLAKSTLFDRPATRILMRAAGTIPVHRPSDAPDLVARNVETFAAAIEALARGAAVGIFPEGRSHDEPALSRLKTGAARLALGFAAEQGRALAIVPIGLVFRDKTVFRSEALAVRGDPVAWADLVARGPDDREAVAELTARLDEALRQVTVNTESWEDRPLVEGAEAVWAAEHDAPGDPSERIARIGRTSAILAALRRGEGDAAWHDLARRLRTHLRRLRRIGLAPADLANPAAIAGAPRRTARDLGPVLPVAAAVAMAGWLLFWVPYRTTGWIADAFGPSPEMRSTYKLLVGVVLYAAWVVALGSVATLALGAVAGLVALVLVPAVGMAGLRVRERWRGAWRDARRLLTLRGRGSLLAALRQEQMALARDLDTLSAAWPRGGS